MSSYQDDGIVDVEKRKADSEHVLGDPTLFPPEFLSWIKRFIEQSGIQLPSSAIFGSFTAGIGSVRNIAPGVIIPYAGSAPPPGALACDGSSHSRTEFVKLFDIIGTIWGFVDANSFNVPDLRDRTLFGAGAQLALGATDGQALGSRGPKHKHTTAVTDPGHNHAVNDPSHNHPHGFTGGAVNSPPNGNILLQGGSSPEQAAQAIGMDPATTGITIAAKVTGIGVTVGPAAGPLDAPGHAGILYVITTG